MVISNIHVDALFLTNEDSFIKYDPQPI